MGQFKPMVKMMTTEPSVILKLKKGGKVEKKADGGFVPMQSTMPAGLPARGGMAPAAAPMKPSMAVRRRAMNPNFAKGGKVEHEDAAQDRAMIKKALSGKKFASGGEIDAAETKTTLKNSTKQFAKTKVVDGDKNDSAKGTKGIKNGNAGGFAMGGTIEGNAAKFAKTKVVDGDKTDTVKGTGKVKNGNAGGFAKGGKVDWENRPADTAKAGVTGTSTAGVRNGNAGGFKKGGSAKKAYAAGGNVVDDGKAVKMPRHFKSQPVANSLQSGTFKKGGKVGKYAEGSSVDAKAISDKASRELEEALNPISMAKELYGKAKSYLTSPASTPGAVTKTKESVTVAPNKKRGGKVC
jgi:hypothetical protein